MEYSCLYQVGKIIAMVNRLDFLFYFSPRLGN